MNNSGLTRPVASPRGTTQSGDYNGVDCQPGAGTVIADQREAGRVSTRADKYTICYRVLQTGETGRSDPMAKHYADVAIEDLRRMHAETHEYWLEPAQEERRD